MMATTIGAPTGARTQPTGARTQPTGARTQPTGAHTTGAHTTGAHTTGAHTTGTRTTGTRTQQPTGAGVVLLEWYNYRVNRVIRRSEPAVILFRNPKSGLFSDAGGNLDANESALQCAERELKEESAGLFRINLQTAIKHKVRHTFLNHCYDAFIVPVVGPVGVGIRKEFYEHNIIHLQNTVAPSSYLETDEMTRFFVSDLVSHGLESARGNLKGVPDVYKVKHTIEGRTKAVLRKALADHLLKWNSNSNNVNYLSGGGICQKGKFQKKIYCYYTK